MIEASGLLTLGENGASENQRAPAPGRGWGFVGKLAAWGEPVWVAALAMVFVIRGSEWIPSIVQLAGRGGRIETAEWLIYLLLGTAFPAIAAMLAWYAPRRVNRWWLIALVAALTVFFLAYGILFLLRAGPGAFLGSTVLGAAVIGGAWMQRQRAGLSDPPLVSRQSLLALIVVSFAWAASLKLASWATGAQWLTQSLWTPVVLALLVIAALRSFGGIAVPAHGTPWWRVSPRDVPALLVLTALSFRTNYIAEFYHWSFWVGPIESVRQGGWLLWDVPSQYGFLSILVPSVVPAPNAWVALYMVQAFLYAVVGAGMFLLFRSFRRDHVGYALALAITATTLFFRPRTSNLLLAAQITPAGGPMRFFWCYVIFGVIAWWYQGRERISGRRFALTGTLAWIGGVAWSAESAIYCTATWFGAYLVFLLQGRALRRPEGTRSSRLSLALGAALPILALGGWIVATSVIYRLADGHPPDWMGYYEYALLFSGGYSALLINPDGPVWYLVAVFSLVSTAAVYFLRSDPRHPRLIVTAGAWGAAWSVSSYFVSRSHPVNLLSLAPMLLVACALVIHSMGPVADQSWARLSRLAFIPLVTMPAALTLAHSHLLRELRRPQPSPVRIAAQIPPMDSSLLSLAHRAGMQPQDPVFFVSDGRWIMPPWPSTHGGGGATTSELSWMPKPYEMISTLSAARRNNYMTRFSQRTGLGGWLVQRKADINPAYFDLLVRLQGTHQKVAAYDNANWIVERYETRSRPSRP